SCAGGGGLCAQPRQDKIKVNESVSTRVATGSRLCSFGHDSQHPYNTPPMVLPLLSKPAEKHDFDPDLFRMTVGEHLEDLRRRIIFGLLGFAIALAVCLIFGDHVFVWFCKPLYQVLEAKKLNTQLHYDEL